MTTDLESNSDLATHSLELVNRELGVTLDRARAEIEEYVDGQANAAALQRAADLLHLASGALKIVEVHGAALLAEEMEHTCRFLADGQNAGSAEKGAEALTRSMVQLPAYLERLLSGGRDVALVLLPLLNDLRSARGKPLMSEGTLLLLRTGPLERPARERDRAQIETQANQQFRALAQQQRPQFQSALLGWIRGAQPESNLDQLVLITSTLEQAAQSKHVQQFWGVLCGVFVALRAGGLESSVALKRLIGQADRQLKRLADEGELAFRSTPPLDLLNNLLYYIARADCDDERIRAIRSDFDLNALIPGEAQLERAREGLAGPSVKLMRTVAEAIKQDLGTVKDSLDIFVRTGMQDLRQLLPQLEMLQKIGDTLSVLGLDSAQAKIRAQMVDLNSMVDASAEVDQEILERIAAVLLSVEDDLDRELVRAVVPSDGQAPAQTESEAQYTQVTQAVMGECMVNLAKVKEAVVKLVDQPADTRALEQVRPQLRGIAAGLLMLNKTTVVRLVERIGNVLAEGLTAPDGRVDAQRIERLADAIVSVEYYMETVSAGRKDPWYMLENAARCLELLERRSAAAVPEAFTAVTLAGEPVEEEPVEAVEAEEVVAQEGEHDTVPQPALKLKGTGVFAAIEGDETRSDPELIEIFIEEAKSEIENIAVSLPKWLDDPGDIDALTATRRSFHTLKGSGRTVGAQAIGDFAWSIEHLLNRLINRTLVPTPAITALVQEAAGALPVLLDQLELGIAPKTDVAALARRADVFAVGQVEVSAEEEVGAPPHVVADAAASIDPVLAEIFVKEMRGHLATIRDYLAKAERQPAPHTVDETLYRASHTLLGSANMANYEPCVVIAEPLSDFLSYCHQAAIRIDDAALATLRQAADAIQAVADGLAEQRTHMPEPALVEALRTLLERARAFAAAKSAAPAPAAEKREAERREPAAPEAEPQLPSEAAEFDPEIAAIFTEEAAEILDQAEMVVQDLRNGTNVAQGFGELQRLLHTLKGGARMAGIMRMGDLSHALETVLAGMAQRRLPTDGSAVDLVQKVLDELQQMRDSVDLGRAFSNASSRLLSELRAFAEGHVAPSVAESQDEGAVMTGLLLETEGTTRPLDGQAPPSAPAEVPAPPEALPFEEAIFSRSDIIEQSINQPLDFDLTEIGLEEKLQTFNTGATSELPTLDDLEPEVFDDEHGLEVTGTVEFSDEQMARLQALAFEEGVSADVADMAEADAAAAAADEFAAFAAAGAQAESPELIEIGDEDVEGQAYTMPISAEQVVAATAAQQQAGAPAAPTARVAEPPAQAAEPAEEAPEPAQPLRQAEPARAAERADTARVDAQLLDSLLNASGEISIFQARLNQQLHSVDFHLGELGQTVTRLREQLRKLEAETEAEILFRHQDDSDHTQGFDPLELDRYSTIQQLSRALSETASDVASINELLLGLTHEADTLLTQQGRVVAEIQDGLMQTRMVPFQRHVARFARVVRQAAADTGKAAELVVNGAHSELDRQVLDSMLPALEHLLRNSVVHGIEERRDRLARGKAETGRITLTLSREGAEVSIDVADDGAGLNLEAIARTALERGLIDEPQSLTAKQAAELILMPGFSTASKLTQSAGRGVGMDVVDNELKKLGGSMSIETETGKGTRFHLRLPYTLAITHALIVDVGDETFALPLTTVEGITRVRREHLLDLLTQDDPRLDYGELSYKLQHLGTLVGAAPSALPQEDSAVALVLVRAGDNSTALLTDRLEGSREVVVKGLGPHIASVPGVTGATILGDGRVIMILDPGTLIRRRPSRRGAAPPPRPKAKTITALVVDDSITMRRVTERLLERRGVRVLTARDGLDAITVLQEHDPDIILLDIEMPRMDGYQFAAHVRNDAKFKDIPIIMITSRSGEKHRAKAIELGVNEYLSKPYQEQHLIAAIEGQLGCEL
jgi:chemosensory pili system protein ChpA (sensor histidine kinase/response regulator)